LGGTSLVLDRLPRAGHIERVRDHPAGNRAVHLRRTAQGMATGMAFFGPLGERSHAIVGEFTAEELSVIRRFVTAAAESIRDHPESLEG
jgi:DNA-binding MarR family transcriptional regulator